MFKKEFLDIIDENDNVIGQEEFAIVHEKGLLHRFTRILIINSKGNFILQQRSPNISDPNKIDSVGGHIQSGESYSQGAIREVEEEYNIKVKENELTLIGNIEDRNRKIQDRNLNRIENMIANVYLIKHDGPFEKEDNEISKIIEISPEEIRGLIEKTPEIISPKLLKSIECYNKYTN